MKNKGIQTLALLLFLVFALTVFAPTALAVSAQAESLDVVYRVVEAMNSQDWDTYIALQCMENQQDYIAFLSNPINAAKHMGLFNIISAKVVEVKELAPNDVEAFSRIQIYKEKYHQVAAYYVGVNYSVYEESKYYFNGVNYALVITGVENNAWKIIEMSDAPIESLVPMGLGFGTNSENVALNIIHARISGIIINPSGGIISKTRTFRAVSGDHGRPDFVRVYRTATEVVENVDYYSYVKNVLPNEWYTSWPEESLKAGAMAVKMYGWYHTYHPKWGSLGADVKDTSVDQCYVPGTENDDGTAAINALNGIGLENSAGKIFETQYYAGTRDTYGTQNGGKISQWGSKKLAEDEFGYLYICRYYYDNSNKSSGQVRTFTY